MIARLGRGLLWAWGWERGGGVIFWMSWAIQMKMSYGQWNVYNWRNDKKSETKRQPNRVQYKTRGGNGFHKEMTLYEKQQKVNHWALETTTVMRLEEKYSPKAGVGKNKAVGKWALTNLGILNIICKEYYYLISYKGWITIFWIPLMGFTVIHIQSIIFTFFKCSF